MKLSTYLQLLGFTLIMGGWIYNTNWLIIGVGLLISTHGGILVRRK